MEKERQKEKNERREEVEQGENGEQGEGVVGEGRDKEKNMGKEKKKVKN